MKNLNILFLMNPLETVKPDKDTSLALMTGAHRRGHKIFFLGQGNIHRLNDKTFFDVMEVTPKLDAKTPFTLHENRVLSEDDANIIFIRTDPPFNEQYLFDTWMLSLLPARITVINDPNGVRTVNEKLWATQFTDITPETLVTRSKARILDFLKEHKSIILKPTNAFGGQSIFHLRHDDINRHALIEHMTRHQSLEIIAQVYLPESATGDKRILLLNGESLGAVLRVHGEDDHRNNFFAGGSAKPAQITPKEHAIINILKPHLQKLGLYLVGIDVIGEKLIEVNVTSPTGMQEINKFSGQHLEDRVIGFVEDLWKQRN